MLARPSAGYFVPRKRGAERHRPARVVCLTASRRTSAPPDSSATLLRDVASNGAGWPSCLVLAVPLMRWKIYFRNNKPVLDSSLTLKNDSTGGNDFSVYSYSSVQQRFLRSTNVPVEMTPPRSGGMPNGKDFVIASMYTRGPSTGSGRQTPARAVCLTASRRTSAPRSVRLR
jgi:hypothetical protein